ncbi:AlkA N-terminal domain-containing protein [Nocardioides cavernaquae]|uniref:DNA-3-methyladenine glycosylase II n=1 Tax=Nocardioides cavernaquae TaxID=2321396 RepID=A0A3A5H2F9_9ACTN|nr:AlkA N-terminal domain-containing protein [Nocardioides cavernaquae]RJS44989.1 DNA-3-methyladenine glycosylase 2 family protein [Nocardioides cavernaquae]
MHTDTEACYRAVKSRDRRFDGVFVTAVHTTGIYCRPSCPARTPGFANVSFFPTSAAAQAAGFRACKRCLPDATPGSPEWDLRADVAGRAMRLTADGVVDREGVPGLAARLGYSPRQLGRILTAELGAGPLALARARRAQIARVLIETTDLGLADVAFAAGFASVRQFNDTVREVYAASPSELRGRRRHGVGAAGEIRLRLAVRTPFAGRALLAFLATRAVAGIETAGPDWYARTLSLPHGPGTVHLVLADAPEPGQVVQVPATFHLTDVRDVSAAVERVRRLLDADCDPVAVDDALSADPALAPLVRSVPGLRVPGHVDGLELAVRAVLGQQVTVGAARALASRLVADRGALLPPALAQDGLTHLFPAAEAIAETPMTGMPASRARTITGLAAAIGNGEVALDRSADRDGVRRALLALPGIGPWTAGYIAMRALADPDVFLPTDAGVKAALTSMSRSPERPTDPDSWSPWRSYALMHLWGSLGGPALGPATGPAEKKEMI